MGMLQSSGGAQRCHGAMGQPPRLSADVGESPRTGKVQALGLVASAAGVLR